MIILFLPTLILFFIFLYYYGKTIKKHKEITKNMHENKDSTYYNSSLIKYMTHRNPIIYIIVVLLLYLWIKIGIEPDLFFPLGFSVTLISYIILSFGYIKQRIVINGSQINIESHMHSSSSIEEKRTSSEYYDRFYYSSHTINDVNEVRETLNSIIIYGKIVHYYSTEEKRGGGLNRINEQKYEELKKISIRKNFKDNKKIVKELKDMIRQQERKMT